MTVACNDKTRAAKLEVMLQLIVHAYSTTLEKKSSKLLQILKHNSSSEAYGVGDCSHMCILVIYGPISFILWPVI